MRHVCLTLAVVVAHRHVKPRSALGDFEPDMAEANNAQLFARDTGRMWNGEAVHPITRLLVQRAKVADSRQNQAKAMVSHAGVIGASTGGHHSATGLQGI